MRLLVSALLAASVSFATFAPAQACISACGGGGGSSTSSTSTSSDTSSSPSESGDSGNHGVPGVGDSATAVFLDSLNFDAMNPSVTLDQALAELRNMRDAEADYARASTTYVRHDTTNLDLHNSDFAGWIDVLAGLFEGLVASNDAVTRLEAQIVARWGQAALDQA